MVPGVIGGGCSGGWGCSPFSGLGVKGRYLEGISRLTLERDHIVHQVALASLHPVTGHGRFGTAAQAHR